MGKGAACVVIYSIILIMLFVAFCYLMTTVNPEPLKVDKYEDSLADAEVKINNILFEDVLSPPDENTLYGIEKNNNMTTAYPYNHRRMHPFKDTNNSTIRVCPPIFPPTTKGPISITTINNISELNDTHAENITRTVSTTNVSKEITEATRIIEVATWVPVKARRRSIKDLVANKNDEEPRSVVLHVLDDSGVSRIEIRLDSKSLFNRNREKVKSYASGFSIGIQSNDSRLVNTSKLAKNTHIKIMPNNTIVIDEFEDVEADEETAQNFPQLIENAIGSNKNSSNIINVTDYVDKFLKLQNEKNTSLEANMYDLKVLFDNETKSMKSIIKNDDFYTTIVKDNSIDVNRTSVLYHSWYDNDNITLTKIKK